MRISVRGKTVVLCSTAAHVEATAGRGVVIVPVTADAYAACTQNGIGCRPLEPSRSAGEIQHDRQFVARHVREFIDVADALVREELGPRAGAFRPAGGSQLLLYCLIAELYLAARSLTDVLVEGPSTIETWVSSREAATPNLAVTAPAHPLIAEDVARRFGVDAVISVDDHDASSVETSAPPPRALVRGSVRRLLAHLRMPARGKTVLFVGGWYDLDALEAELRARGVAVARFPAQLLFEPDETFADLARRAAAEPRLHEPLDALGVDDLTFLHQLLGTWWTAMVPGLWRAYGDARRTLSRGPHAAVVASEAGGGTAASAVLQAAFEAGVPATIYQHGSSCIIDASLWEGWLTNCDQLLVYGEGTASLLEQTRREGAPPPARVVPVGSARLDRPAGRAHKESPPRRVLYVPAMFGMYGRLMTDLAAYPDDTYLELQLSVVRLFANRPRTQLVYKTPEAANAHPNPVVDFIRSKLPGAEIVTRPPLVELGDAIDAVVVDHPVTALAEAALTSTPLVAYVPEALVMCPEVGVAIEALGRRGTVATDSASFLAAIERLLAGETGGDVSDRTFVRRYVTYRDDGNSAARAADAVLAR